MSLGVSASVAHPAASEGGTGQQGRAALRGGRLLNRLTERAIRTFIAEERQRPSSRKLTDGGGLFLTVTPAGSPLWRVKYRHGEKERTYSLGAYPEVTLEAARDERARVKAQLRQGLDPVKQRQLDRAAAQAASDATFGALAAEWLEQRRPDWSARHYDRSKRALERDVYPYLARLPIASITPAMVARPIEKIAMRGARDTAGKVLRHVVGIFRFAQARGICSENPAPPVREILARKRPKVRRPALLRTEELGELLRRAEQARISPPVRVCHRLIALTAARAGNAIAARWEQFDLDATPATWTIPRSQMKVRDRGDDHRIILGPTIAAELRSWRRMIGGRGYVFPSPSKRRQHITHESLEKALRVTLKMAGVHAPHGWRASFSTLARDAGFARDVVELALDHIHDTEVVRAYDRGKRWDERVRLAYWWDAQLTAAQHGGEPLPLALAVS